MNENTSNNVEYRELCIELLYEKLKKAEERLKEYEEFSSYECLKEPVDSRDITDILKFINDISANRYTSENRENSLIEKIKKKDINGLVRFIREYLEYASRVRKNYENLYKVHRRLEVALKSATGLKDSEIEKIKDGSMTHDDIISFIRAKEKDEQDFKTIEEIDRKIKIEEDERIIKELKEKRDHLMMKIVRLDIED